MVANKLSLSGCQFSSCRSWSGSWTKFRNYSPFFPVSLFLRINRSWLSCFYPSRETIVASSLNSSIDASLIIPTIKDRKKFRVSKAFSEKVKSSIIKFSLNNHHEDTLTNVKGEFPRAIHVALEFLGLESKNDCPVKRLSSIRGSHFRFTGGYEAFLLPLHHPASHHAAQESILELDTVEENIAGGGFRSARVCRLWNRKFQRPLSRRPTPRERRPLLDSPSIQTYVYTRAAPRAMGRSPRAFAWITGNRLSVSVPPPFSFPWISTVNSCSTFIPLFSISFLQVRLKVASRTSFSFSWYINTYMSSFSSSIKLGIFLCILRFSLFGVVWRDFFFTRRWQNWIEGNSKVFP